MELGTSSCVDVVVVVADVATNVEGDCTCTEHPALRDSLSTTAPCHFRCYFQKEMSGLMWTEVDGGVVKEEVVADPGSTELHDSRKNPRVEEVRGEP